jgi:hypothetical protein
MWDFIKALRMMLNTPQIYMEKVSGLRLRAYQVTAFEAICQSVIQGLGLTIVVEMARQGGKNEVQAQLQAYLLARFSRLGGEIVIVSPTFKPQTENAMRRLRRVLEKNWLIQGTWKMESGYVFRLIVDEAQDVSETKFYKDFLPMAASTNATVALFGTAWTMDTLLAKEKKRAQALEAQDGRQRVFVADADVISRDVPAYGQHVQGVIVRLGRQHPIVKSQYFLEAIDAEGGMFPAARRAMVRGRHSGCEEPVESMIYAITIDVAGQDESAKGGVLREVQPRKDSTALTIAEVDTSTLENPMLMAPNYRIVKRHYWTGTKHVALFGQIAAICALWSPAYILVDATGIGEPLYSFLFEFSKLSTVIGMKFTSKSKSDLGYRFLAAIDSGRFKDLSGQHDRDGLAAQMQREMAFCQYEIKIGPAKIMTWGVPDGKRDETGTMIHDDLLISAAMLTELDTRRWPVVTESSTVIQGIDPLAEIDKGGF